MKVEKYIEIAKLLNKQLLGELTESEKSIVEKWMLNNNELYNDIREEILKGEHKREYDRIDVEKGWEQHEHHLSKQFKRIAIYKVLKVAAIFTLILLVGSVMYYLLPRPTENIRLTENIIAPGSAKAVLILADGTSVGLTDEDKVIEQKGMKLANSTGKLTYDNQIKTKLSPLINTLSIPRGGEYQLELSDGTKVWLNSMTRLKYPIAFSEGVRKVFLEEGEAYFEVAHDANHPFIVATNKGMEVEVLGTSFNLMAYEEETEIQTTLVEGSVQVKLNNHEKVRIKPGEQACFNKSGMSVVVNAVDVNPYIAWRNGRFVFEQEMLLGIMTKLSRWYDVDVFYQNESVKNKRLSANLKRYDSIHSFLDLFEQVSSLHFEVNGRTILVKEGMKE